MTQRIDCTEGADIDHAAEVARQAVYRGECVVLPTDTVYGIGADAFSPDAVQRLLDAKERGRDMPPPVLIGEPAVLDALAIEIPEACRRLTAAFWPGALTVICRAQPSLRMDLGDTAGTIAVRVPAHDVARALLSRTGPLAVSSANLSGQPAARTADEAIAQLDDRVAVYLDAGTAPGGEASTIVDFTTSPDGVIVRAGALGPDDLRRIVPGVASGD